MSTQSALLDPEMAQLFLRGKSNYQNLNEVDRLNFQILMSNLLYELEITLEQHKAGFVTDELLVPYEYHFKELVSHPGVKEYLEKNRSLHGSTFQNWLNKEYG